MTIINEDWERQLILDSMFSEEEQMQTEEDYYQWLEYENQQPALIEVQMFNTPIYEYSRLGR